MHFFFIEDIWSFACTCLELLDLTIPYASVPAYEVPLKLKNNELPEVNPEWRPEIQDLIKNCWALNPSDRPSAKEVYGTLKKIVEEKLAVNPTNASCNVELEDRKSEMSQEGK